MSASAGREIGGRAEKLAHIARSVKDADLVLIGASNGLDMAEGLNIFATDAHFSQEYGDLARHCGARSILEGMFLSRGDAGASWAWGSRFARTEWLDYEPSGLMRILAALVGEKDHFVLTCNTDGRFVRAGFDPRCVLETEGSVREMVCSAHCCDERYDSTSAVVALDASIAGGKADESLIPTCLHCGAKLELAIDEARLRRPDAACEERLQTLAGLLAKHRGGNVVVLELGVGLRNGIIKHILATSVQGEPNLTYAIFNYNQVVPPQGLEDRCLGIDGDMATSFVALGNLL